MSVPINWQRSLMLCMLLLPTYSRDVQWSVVHYRWRLSFTMLWLRNTTRVQFDNKYVTSCYNSGSDSPNHRSHVSFNHIRQVAPTFTPIRNIVALAIPVNTKTTFDRFGRFCRAHGRDQYTDRATLRRDICSSSSPTSSTECMRCGLIINRWQ